MTPKLQLGGEERPPLTFAISTSQSLKGAEEEVDFETGAHLYLVNSKMQAREKCMLQCY